MKGFTPESRDALTALADGRVAGDRVLAFLLGDASDSIHMAAGAAWWPKTNMLALVNTPALTRLALRYDEAAARISIRLDGQPFVEGGLDAAGRARIAEAVGSFARAQPEHPNLGRSGRLPLRLIGDGRTARYQDSPEGYVTLHGRGSIRALGAALGDPALDERRFRSNIVLDGMEAWEEFVWAGRALRIGEVAFDVFHPGVRCLATHASPSEGRRDRDVLGTLVKTFGHERPSFAMHLAPRYGGEIRLGDAVELIE
ncbi:MAG: MOSC domain-containing protein [Vicinamibacteria bacterium]